jgi:ubiquinone/menaquinone biosynthesis C-methylase UbiE
MQSVAGDATNLHMFADRSFDLVFSNSVIEHLFTWENQQKMAAEVQRVSKRFFIQTPNYWFPVEPHWVFPFFQYLPFPLRVFLTHNFSLGHIQKCLSKREAIEQVKEIRLLSLQEMKQLFPDASIYAEKFVGMNKSFIAYKI